MGERHICFIDLFYWFHLSVFFSRDIIIFSEAGKSQRYLLCRTAQQCCQRCWRWPPRTVVVCSHHANSFVTVLSPHQSTQTICDTDSYYVALAAASQTSITVLLGGWK